MYTCAQLASITVHSEDARQARQVLKGSEYGQTKDDASCASMMPKCRSLIHIPEKRSRHAWEPVTAGLVFSFCLADPSLDHVVRLGHFHGYV